MVVGIGWGSAPAAFLRQVPNRTKQVPLAHLPAIGQRNRLASRLPDPDLRDRS